jgi:hypothetical protein
MATESAHDASQPDNINNLLATLRITRIERRTRSAAGRAEPRLPATYRYTTDNLDGALFAAAPHLQRESTASP